MQRLDVAIGLALVLMTLVVFAPVLKSDFVDYDDNIYVTENPQVQAGLTCASIGWAFTATHSYNWHPLTWLSLQLDAQLYTLARPWGFHLTNLLLHTANVLLLFVVLRRMTGASWRSGAVAALFAVHPLHVESVAWVAERKDVLSTFFWMLTLWAYAWYVERPWWPRYLPVVVLFALGLMAKPMLVTLPCVLLLLDYWPLGRFRRTGATDAQPHGVGAANPKAINVARLGESGLLTLPDSESRATAESEAAAAWPPLTRLPIRRLLWEKVPLFALVVASSVITVIAQGRGGAIRTLEEIPLGSRVLNALLAYVGYLGKMFWPAGLAVFYAHPTSRAIWPLWQALAAGVLLAGISAFVLRRVRQQPYLAVGWLWYLGTLVPVIGLVQVGGQALADRYTYIPLIGVFLLLSWGFPDLLARWRFPPALAEVMAGVVLLACIRLTGRQLEHWRDTIRLWQHTIEVDPKNAQAHFYLAVTLSKQGNLREAINHYDEAVVINPDYADAHFNLGVASKKLGRAGLAESHFRNAVALRPGSAESHYNLGLVLAEQGMLVEAEEHFREAIKLQPEYLEAQHDLGLVLRRQGRIDEAIKHYRHVLTRRPTFAMAHANLGTALGMQKKFGEAVVHFAEAGRLDPADEDTRRNLAVALHLANEQALTLATSPNPEVRNAPLALELARQVCQATDNRNPEYLATLAEAQAANGNYAEAAASARRALTLASATGQAELERKLQAKVRLYEDGQSEPDGQE